MKWEQYGECEGQMSIEDFLQQEVLEVDIRGYCDDGYCPRCSIWLDDLIEECPECGSKMDWTRWRKMNGQMCDTDN